MKVVVMGCGRVGARVASILDHGGHTVSVIDLDFARVSALAPEFAGDTVIGTGIDEDVLRSAGIEQADVFIAVTDGDNRNIMAGQVARAMFGVHAGHHADLRSGSRRHLPATRLRDRLPDNDGFGTDHRHGDQVADQRSPNRTRRDADVYIIVAGGGKVGYYLTKTLLNEGHEVLLIERDHDKVETYSERFGSVVLEGDAAEASVDGRGRSRPGRCADRRYRRRRRQPRHLPDGEAQVSRAENHCPGQQPQNEELFKKLNTDVTVSQTNYILGLIEQAIPESGVHPSADICGTPISPSSRQPYRMRLTGRQPDDQRDRLAGVLCHRGDCPPGRGDRARPEHRPAPQRRDHRDHPSYPRKTNSAQLIVVD